MTTLKMDDSTARRLYPTASAEIKTLLETSFTKEFFNQKITDRVKTFEDACSVLDVSAQVVCPFGFPSANLTGDDLSIQSYAKLIIIARALNEGWTPDWSNHNQYKYYPWFKEKAGFGLSFDVYAFWYSLTFVGSRLCFKTAELAEYAGKQFESIYRDYLSL